MAIKKITNWKDPIWNQQEGESDRANHYREQFTNMNYNVTQFTKVVLHSSIKFQESSSKVPEIDFLPSDLKFNEANKKDIETFIKTDGKKGKPCKPSPQVMVQWAKNHQWLYRRRAQKDDLKQSIIENVKDNIVDQLTKVANLELENTILNLEKQNENLRSEEPKEYQIRAQAETNQRLQESLLSKVNPFETEDTTSEDDDAEELTPCPRHI